MINMLIIERVSIRHVGYYYLALLIVRVHNNAFYIKPLVGSRNTVVTKSSAFID